MTGAENLGCDFKLFVLSKGKINMNENFQYDYYRMTGNKYIKGPKNFISIYFNHRLRYMLLWRKFEKKPTFLTKLKLYRLTRKYGLEISTSAKIGKGLYLGHPYNITVAGEAELGNNVNLHKGCTIGRENRGMRNGAPKIGNNVYIGINAIVVGNIKIGNDVLIAPNSFVNFDVPDHCIVIGNPASVHIKEEATKGYVNFLV